MNIHNCRDEFWYDKAVRDDSMHIFVDGVKFSDLAKFHRIIDAFMDFKNEVMTNILKGVNGPGYFGLKLEKSKYSELCSTCSILGIMVIKEFTAFSRPKYLRFAEISPKFINFMDELKYDDIKIRNLLMEMLINNRSIVYY